MVRGGASAAPVSAAGAWPPPACRPRTACSASRARSHSAALPAATSTRSSGPASGATSSRLLLAISSRLAGVAITASTCAAPDSAAARLAAAIRVTES